MATVTSVEKKARITVQDFKPDVQIDWCPGCGDFGILSALQQALAGLGLQPHQVSIFGGIGCSGKAQYYVNGYNVHTLHGRVLPYATGAKLANPDMTVIAVGGDGDGMAIGAGHFVNSGRRNVDLTYIMFNNEVYGLTKGQASPTLPLGVRTRSLPEPNIQGPVNSLMLALTSGFTWIGRGYAYDVRHLTELTRQAIEHPGLAFLEVLQPCPTYNNVYTRDWFAGKDRPDGKPRLYNLQDEGYDPVVPEGASQEEIQERLCAFQEKAYEWGDRIPIGVFLVNRTLTTFEDRLQQRTPTYRAAPPARRLMALDDGSTAVDMSDILAELTLP